MDSPTQRPTKTPEDNQEKKTKEKRGTNPTPRETTTEPKNSLTNGHQHPPQQGASTQEHESMTWRMEESAKHWSPKYTSPPAHNPTADQKRRKSSGRSQPIDTNRRKSDEKERAKNNQKKRLETQSLDGGQ